MPLSENEQKIFTEIEKNLQDADPKFASEFEGSAVYKQAFRLLRVPLAGLLLGFSLMVGTLLVHYLLSFLGFLVMVVSAVFLERKCRAVGSAGIKDISSVLNSYRPSPGRKKSE